MSADGERIFVSVASFCDPLLAFTLRSAHERAADPSRLVFGVVEQALPGEATDFAEPWAEAQARWLRVDALQSRGACWARALAMSLYQDEAWFLQLDSHMWFDEGWDERLLHWARWAAERHPRHLLTCYPNAFTMVDGAPQVQLAGTSVLAHVVRDDSRFEADHPLLSFEGVPVDSDEPLPGLHLGAGCLFAPGRFVRELPYDPQLYFLGEEQSLALRAYTRGWDILHPPAMPIYHQYLGAETARLLHWSPQVQARRALSWQALADAGRRRLRALLWEGADLGVYGLGTVRTLADYAAFSGIDYAARSIAPRARKARFGLPGPEPMAQVAA